MRDVIARIVDGSRFREFKKEYGTTMVTVCPYFHLCGVLLTLDRGSLMFMDMKSELLPTTEFSSLPLHSRRHNSSNCVLRGRFPCSSWSMLLDTWLGQRRRRVVLRKMVRSPFSPFSCDLYVIRCQDGPRCCVRRRSEVDSDCRWKLWCRKLRNGRSCSECLGRK